MPNCDELDIQVSRIMPELTRLTAKKLLESQDLLAEVTWQVGESNTDTGYASVAMQCCYSAFQLLCPPFSMEVNPPDLQLFFSNEQGGKVERKIELKSSSKGKRIVPGSMIRSLDINQWTIFCVKENDNFLVRYGRYHLGTELDSHERFQDRSPRPLVRFDNFQDPDEIPNVTKSKMNYSDIFPEMYARSAINRVLNPSTYSWQDDMVSEIIREVLNDPDKFDKFRD